jgi:hypothetical protein
MAEELVLPDFDEWLASQTYEKVKYNAAFDADSGRLLSVGPETSVNEEKYKNIISVKSDIAEDIIAGKINIHKCFVDPSQGELEIIETKSLFTIDDVLHRIIEKKWSEIEKPDIYIIYDRAKGKMVVKLSEEFGGTHKQDKKFHPITQRKIFWDGQTKLDFTITAYNDPHIVYNTLSVSIEELIGKSVTFDVDHNEFVSIYTKRLFKNYMVEEV